MAGSSGLRRIANATHPPVLGVARPAPQMSQGQRDRPSRETSLHRSRRCPASGAPSLSTTCRCEAPPQISPQIRTLVNVRMCPASKYCGAERCQIDWRIEFSDVATEHLHEVKVRGKHL